MIVAQVYIGFFPSFNKASFIPAVPPPRGGVTGREFVNDGALGFFSDGFKICKNKHTHETNIRYDQEKVRSYLKTTHQCFINGHHRSCIIEFSAIIWRRK